MKDMILNNPSAWASSSGSPRREKYEEAISMLSCLILHHRSQAMNEEQEAGRSPDESDRYIATHRNAVSKLRRMREELENIYAEKDYLEP